MAVVAVAPGQGEQHRMIDGDHIAKAVVIDDVGSFELFEVHPAQGPPAPPHVSPWTGVLYVLEGTVRVVADDVTHELGPGGAVTVPAGTSVTFEATDPARTRFLAITSGTGAGRFFADFARSVPVDRPLAESLPDMLAVTRRHGVQVAAPGATVG